MPADVSRFPEGILINHSLLVASPVGTIIENGSVLYISTNAAIPAYTPIAPGGSYPQGTPLTFITAAGTVSFTGGATDVVITDTGGSGLVFGDSVPLYFGTSQDVLFNPTGGNLVIQQSLGAGRVIFADALPVSWGTSQDVNFLMAGGNLLVVQGAGLGVMLLADDTVRFSATADPTKRLGFDVSGVTAGQTRILTAPDYNWAPGVSVSPAETADPGDAAAIPVTGTTSISLTIGAGAETNTLAAPTAVGQVLSLIASTVGGGTRAITASAGINKAGNTVMTFAAVSDWIMLRAVRYAGALVWRVAANDGVGLS